MMPKLMPYSKDLPYGYATGVFPSHALLDARPDLAKRLLIHSAALDSEGVSALIARCEALGIRMETADHALSRISRKENCYAAIVFDKFDGTLSPSASHIVLHHPADMGNLGTILRTCLGFGIKDLAIIHPAADVFDPRVVRASMGALFSMRIAYFDSFEAYRETAAEHAPYPFMLDGSLPLDEATMVKQSPFSLIFGNEGSGLPASFSTVGQPVRIVHSNEIDSLNLAIAVSIGVYAFTRES